MASKKIAPQPSTTPQGSTAGPRNTGHPKGPEAKRGPEPEVPSGLDVNASKKAKTKEDFKDFRTITQIIDGSSHGRHPPEGQYLSYVNDLLDEMVKEYPLDRDKKIEPERLKCRVWAEHYAQFLNHARKRLESEQDKYKSQHTGASSEDIASAITRIDTELSKEPVKEAIKRLPSKASTIAEACEVLEDCLQKYNDATTERSEINHQRRFRVLYEKNQELIRNHMNDPQWKNKIQKFNTFLRQLSRERNKRLPPVGNPDFEKVFKGQRVALLKRMHEIEYEFFTGDKKTGTDFKSLYQEYKNLRGTKKYEDKKYKDKRELTKDLLPPGVSKEDFECLRNAFRSFRTPREGMGSVQKALSHFGKAFKPEEEVEKNKENKEKLEELITKLLDARKRFLEETGNEEVVTLLSKMKEAREKAAMLEWDAASGPASRLEDWGIVTEELNLFDDVPLFLLDDE